MLCEKIKNTQAADHLFERYEPMVVAGFAGVGFAAENGGTSAQTLAQHYQKLERTPYGNPN
jgi:hypothetical protein